MTLTAEGDDPNFFPFSSDSVESVTSTFLFSESIHHWFILEYNVLIVTIIVLDEHNTASDCDNITMEIE